MILALITTLALQAGDELSPPAILERLNGIRMLMEKSAEDLHASLPGRARDRQVKTIQAIDELLRQARESAGDPSSRRSPANGSPERRPLSGSRSPGSASRRVDPGEAFRGVGGRNGWSAGLPASMR